MGKRVCGLLAVLGAALFLCACVAGGQLSAPSQTDSDAGAPAPQTPAPEQQTPSADSAPRRDASSAAQEHAPASGPSAASDSLPAPEPPPAQTPGGETTEAPAQALNPLTGLPWAEGADTGARPLAVMLDNVQAALPQRGLQSAELVYEMVTEGGITRLMAVFSDPSAMPQTGPVRSARDQHVQMLLPLGALYLHVGGSTYAKELLSRYHYETLEIDGQFQAGALTLDAQRSQTAAIEHCWFTDGALFAAAAAQYRLQTQRGGAAQPAFSFVPPEEARRALSGGGAREVYVRFSSYANSSFVYDAERGVYEKSQFGAPQIDANTGETLTFDNLLLLFTETEKYPDGVLTKMNLDWGGVGYYVCGGRCEAVRWAKGLPEAPLRILLADGSETPAALNPGRTYVAMVGLDMYPYFRIDGAPAQWDAAA